MKVIFVKDLKGQGKRNDVKEVKDGYGKNYLIKNGYAIPANDSNVKMHNRELKQEADDENKVIKQCEAIKKELSKVTLNYQVKTGTMDRVFGTVSSKALADELHKKGFDIDKKTIMIKSPISSLGTHKVEIELHKKVVATLNVVLSKR